MAASVRRARRACSEVALQEALKQAREEVLGEKAQGSLEKLQRERAAVQDSPWARDDWDSSDDEEEDEGGAAGDGSERRKTAV